MTPLCFIRFTPWRSAIAGWTTTTLALVLGVPLFLCMPPWNDVTLHDMAARSMIRGGVHYRDVFDTNLPGIDWAMAGIRMAFGWSYEALRAVDLAVIAAEVSLLLLWVRKAGAAGYTVAWIAAAAALFYPFTSEFNHVQRDPWLLLPALAAARMRLLRTIRPMSCSLGQTPDAHPAFAQSQNSYRSGGAVLEGLLWGTAVWVKPHVLIPAAAIWLLSARMQAKYRSLRQILLDLTGVVSGGLIAGSLGVAWLMITGAWPYFLDVFLNWNPSYLHDMWGTAPERLLRTFGCFRMWSVLHGVAIPLAVLALWEAHAYARPPGKPPKFLARSWVAWVYSSAGNESVASARALLAIFYFGWFIQAVFLQKGFDYVQVPLLLLAMAVVATQRWAIGFADLIWFAMLAILMNCPALAPLAQRLEPWLPSIRSYQDALTDFQILKLWPRCWGEGGSPELRNKLAHFTHVHCGTDWEDLEAVAGYLRTLNPSLGPGELNCWHDSTHPLYLMLNLEPATRYMHYGTVFGIPRKRETIAEEVASSRQKYVVSDLLRMTWSLDDAYAPGAHGDWHQLPEWFPVSQRNAFPWNQPIVFRAGRYVVHKIERPLGLIDVPDWVKLDELGPGVK